MKRALLVGINTYPGCPLNGCVNDVSDMAQTLVGSFGFQHDDIRLVTDARATTEAIKDRLSWLVSGTTAGDTLYFHYSGHGAIFPLRDAAGNVTESHGSLCPVDFDWTRDHAIFDTDLRDIIDTVADGVEFLFVSDSCHSGTLMRGFRLWQPRFFPPPADIAWRLQTAAAKGIAPTMLVPHDKCGFISGCTFEQESADALIGGRYNGALSYYLRQQLETDAGRQLALGPLVAAVVSTLASNNYPQTPQLHGPDPLRARAFLAV